MIVRIVYQCEHCKKGKRSPTIRFNKSDIQNHENRCFYNPERKTCFTCAHKLKRRNSEGHNIMCGFENIDYSDCCSFSDCVKVNCKNWEQKGE